MTVLLKIVTMNRKTNVWKAHTLCTHYSNRRKPSKGVPQSSEQILVISSWLNSPFRLSFHLERLQWRPPSLLSIKLAGNFTKTGQQCTSLLLATLISTPTLNVISSYDFNSDFWLKDAPFPTFCLILRILQRNRNAQICKATKLPSAWRRLTASFMEIEW